MTTASRHRKWPWFVGAVVVLLVLAGLAAYAVLEARSHAQVALSDFQYVQGHVLEVSSSTGRADLESHLQAALNESQAAKSSLTSTVVLGAAQWVPYFGGEIRGATTLFGDAALAAKSGLIVLRAVNSFQVSDTKGVISNASLVALQRDIAAASTTVASLDRPVGSLFGPVARERVAFNQKVVHTLRALRTVSDALTVGQSIFGGGGTSTVLVLPENNAEMRDQGAILDYSLLHVHGASIDVVRSGHSYALNLSSPLHVSATAGTKFYFYPSGANEIWQSVNGPADFAWTGTTAAAMFKKATGIRVNDIIALDVPCLAAILGVTGPLTVPGLAQPLTSSNVSTVVLHDLYVKYAVGSQEPRYSELNAIASALLKRIRSTRHDQVAFLRALAGEIPGRHLLLWSASSTVEQAIVHLGASGEIDTIYPRRTFHVAVESAVADKMDYYVTVHVNYVVTLTAGGGARVNATVTLVNSAPAGQPPSYQLGPYAPPSQVPGQYIGNVYLWSPAGSKVGGGRVDSGLVLSGYSASVLPQHSTSVSFSTYLPTAVVHGQLLLHFVPQPRLAPETMTVSVHGAQWRVTGPPATTLTLAGPLTLTYAVHR